MKIGILGGSFDPIHNGHLNMALESYEQYHLDEIWLIPNGNAPHKDADRMADALKRISSIYPSLIFIEISTLPTPGILRLFCISKLGEYP